MSTVRERLEETTGRYEAMAEEDIRRRMFEDGDDLALKPRRRCISRLRFEGRHPDYY